MKYFKSIIFFLFFHSVISHANNKIDISAIEKSSYATISERVLRIAYNRMGIEMTVIDLPAERAIHDANAGVVDGELYRIKDVHLKYKNLIMIPVPIGIMEGIAITKNKSLNLTKWDDLKDHRVCIRNGVKFSEAGTRNFSVRSVNSNYQLFGMLTKNRCDVIIIAHLTSIPLTVDFSKKEKIKLYKHILQVYPLYHYLHKKNSHLVPKLVEVLKKMEDEGVIADVRAQYISEISSQ
ncbi:ABC transporter substrate-binding protein [Motiliproteus sp. MSK22-1]|uniref:substrate-binding periplasmic protein n=1 Tax=Motiliproteus sp. MSK22-1 TaxID=1897630 RepID=UPI00097794E4|nr:transporter substrate-binding domain-containing protein [Motiliproteus sp. MSK22-1]OMH29103.1 hypothetical protein BGP75_20330 [Motiliproteus sp. MSK22-1]